MEAGSLIESLDEAGLDRRRGKWINNVCSSHGIRPPCVLPRVNVSPFFTLGPGTSNPACSHHGPEAHPQANEALSGIQGEWSVPDGPTPRSQLENVHGHTRRRYRVSSLTVFRRNRTEGVEHTPSFSPPRTLIKAAERCLPMNNTSTSSRHTPVAGIHYTDSSHSLPRTQSVVYSFNQSLFQRLNKKKK